VAPTEQAAGDPTEVVSGTVLRADNSRNPFVELVFTRVRWLIGQADKDAQCEPDVGWSFLGACESAGRRA
jgi:hypothetical protein